MNHCIVKNILKPKKNLTIIKWIKIFYENKIPKEGVYCVFLSIILIDSVFKMDNCYYPQMFSEKCKYVAKERKRGILLMKT